MSLYKQPYARVQTLEANLTSLNCPICKLSQDEVENISESQAESLIGRLQQTQGWCFDHIFAFTDLSKRFPFEAREWLREMVLGAKKLEA